jgi:hypothetical protein
VSYLPAPEDRFGADLADLMQRVRTLQIQVAALTSGALIVTSATHPANPVVGMEIYETDTGLHAHWSGSAWVYPPQRLDGRVLTAGAASITLSVPAGASLGVLRVAWTARSDTASAATYMCLRLNGDSGNNYTFQLNQANANAASTGGNSNGLVGVIEIGTMAGATATAGYLGSGEFTIPNASGGTYKTAEGFSNSANSSTNGYSGTYGGLWQNTAAVTSITLLPLAGSLVAGSAAYLYGMT